MANAALQPDSASGMLFGTIRVGSDGASFRFQQLQVDDGRTFPICAIGAANFVPWGPGVAIADPNDPTRVPDSELHPKDYIYITTGRLRIRLAPYLPEGVRERASVK